MTYFRFSRVVTVFCIVLFLLCHSFTSGQDASEFEPAEPLTIKVSVNEVRLDVVVLDKKGNPITDLTSADFEVFQDNKRQEVIAAVYVDTQPDTAMRAAAAQKNVSNLSLLTSSTALKKEDVLQTIMFVVDDFAMDFENGYNTKTALRNFVEKQMQPGDLVAILRTNYGNRVLNMFQSEKREVLARINTMPSTMAPRPQNGTGTGVNQAMWEDFLFRRYENEMYTLSYSIRTLNNMPGRKILVMATPFSEPEGLLTSHESELVEEFTKHMVEDFSIEMLGDIQDRRADNIMRNPWRRTVEESYKRLADDALLAGVVINYLDIDGLQNYKDPTSKNNYNEPPLSQYHLLKNLQRVRFDPVPMPNPLAAMTGGVTIMNSNLFLDGIGNEVESLMRGYYLVSYAPPPDTFKTSGRKDDDDYRSLKVRVKRSGATVHTRSGFFGKPEKESDTDTPVHPLIEAVYSPFRNDDINVNIAAGYIKDAEAGYRVRAWIHLDPGDVTIVETTDGRGRIDLEALCLASDINGNIQDSKSVEFTLSNFNVDWVRKHGLRFSMLLPVKRPGPYYVRIAVKDKESTKTGSAYQFLDIPDLGKKGLNLSNIFMVTSVDDLNWIRPDATKEIAEGVFFPMFQEEGVKSPALRTYASGDKLQTLALLYNADAKAIGRSEIETQTILYKDGAELQRGASTPLKVDKVENADGIPLLNRLTVGTNMPPGDYVLQLVVTDKKNGKKKEGNATQILSFTVAENQTCETKGAIYGSSD